MLGAAVSLTGKYALNGTNTKNGYDLAVHKINDKGGVSIGGRPYRLVVRYYDDEFDSGARHRARRAAGEAGRRQIHARALQLGPDQGDPAGRREIQGADGRGEWLRARAVHQGLSLRVRRALHLGPISHARHRPRRRARRRSRQDQGQAQSRARHGERSVRAGRARRRARRRATPRHDGGDRRSAAARAQRHVGRR